MRLSGVAGEHELSLDVGAAYGSAADGVGGAGEGVGVQDYEAEGGTLTKIKPPEPRPANATPALAAPIAAAQ